MVELFAGVGGFRLGLETHGWETVWANQWEPSTKTQHAAECYRDNFGNENFSNEDIQRVAARLGRSRSGSVPDHDLLVAGFPCQDYSVAKARNQALGIAGDKGALWWALHRILKHKRPALVLLENVDRILKSPAGHKGRDFSVILASLAELGYLVEWRVVNAADYGFPQRRRRLLLLAQYLGQDEPRWDGPASWIAGQGVLARAFRAKPLEELLDAPSLQLRRRMKSAGTTLPDPGFPFRNAGVLWRNHVWTYRFEATYHGRRMTLGDILQDAGEVARPFYVPRHQIRFWRYQKEAKAVPRVASNGFRYLYSEGRMPFPDALDAPARTILTGEGGSTPSRFKHIIQQDGRWRRLTPIELERLNGFPDDWTGIVNSPGRRAFLMGNALVVGLIGKVAPHLAGAAAGRAAASTRSA